VLSQRWVGFSSPSYQVLGSRVLVGREMAAADVEYRCFVGGLAWATDNASLQQAFASYGDVLDSKVITDRETGRSRGFGFVTFSSEQSMLDAIEAMNGKELDGRNITVNQAQSRRRLQRRRRPRPAAPKRGFPQAGPAAPDEVLRDRLHQETPPPEAPRRRGRRRERGRQQEVWDSIHQEEGQAIEGRPSSAPTGSGRLL
jgi:RNA recognition motif-containing protein